MLSKEKSMRKKYAGFVKDKTEKMWQKISDTIFTS